ncbi:hypothetical protein TNCV_1791851, partial [Trichonephila clavipes]
LAESRGLNVFPKQRSPRSEIHGRVTSSGQIMISAPQLSLRHRMGFELTLSASSLGTASLCRQRWLYFLLILMRRYVPFPGQELRKFHATCHFATFLRSDWPRPFARREVGVEMELGRSENKRPEQRRS